MSEKPQFASLTGFRAVAALMVYFSHFNPMPGGSANTFSSRFFYEMQCGVGLFFVLSGFLITHNYYHLTSKFDFKVFRRYMWNRFVRIYPVFFLITIATFIYNRFDGDYDVSIFLLNITFLKGFTHCYIFSGIMPGWSLTVEEVFYLLAPFIFLFIYKQSFNKIIRRLGVVVLVGYTIVALMWWIYQLNTELCWSLGRNQAFLYTYFGRSFDFACGIFLALWWKNRKQLVVPKFPVKTVIGVLWIVSSIFMVALLRDNNVDLSGIRTIPGLVLNNLYLPIGVTLFIAGLTTERSFLATLLGSKLMTELGKSSYSFYLLHVGFVHVLLFGFFGNEIFSFISLLLISYLLYRFVEHPIHRKLRLAHT